ncbi:MAG: hypothetical protein SGPRY_003890, partial [Prymnesium sp.]
RLKSERVTRRSKLLLRRLWERGKAETFAARQYRLGHLCDDSRRWLHSTSPYEAPYQFGCEPYLLLRKETAPMYDERFVGYGKDRVSFTYELAARGARLIVQPDLFVVHFTTVQSGIKYRHAPSDWMVGETCWPQVEANGGQSMPPSPTAPYLYLLPPPHRQVARKFGLRGELEARCVVDEEGLCVHPCRSQTAEDHYARGLGWYLAHFAGVATRPANSTRLLIDGSKGLLASYYAAARLRHSLAESAHRHRIVIVLRDPSELALALWRALEAVEGGMRELISGYLVGHNFTHKVLEETSSLSSCLSNLAWSSSRKGAAKRAVNTTISLQAWQQCIATECGWGGCVVGAGLFAPQLRSWRLAYGTGQVAVFTLGELKRTPAAALRHLFHFTGEPMHPSSERGPMEVVSIHTSVGRRMGEDSDEAIRVRGEGRRGGWRKEGKEPRGHNKRRQAHRRERVRDQAGVRGGGGSEAGDAVSKVEEGSERGREKSRGAAGGVGGLAGGESSARGGSFLHGRATALPPDFYRALGAPSAISHLRSEVKEAEEEGSKPPPAAYLALRRFFARYAPAVRYELEQLGQDLGRWLHDEWLWDDDISREKGLKPSMVSRSSQSLDGTSESILPSVFLIGGEKCGSTSLAFAVSRHPQLHLARHTLPSEPQYFRKELHFFDDDLRYARGLDFYAAHYPRCSSPSLPFPPYWASPPRKRAEVLLEDVKSGESVGWDAELNIPTNAHKTVLLLPASPSSEKGVGGVGGGRRRAFWLVDASSNRLLYLRQWVLRAAPLSFADEKKLFVLIPASPKSESVPSFYLVDRSSSKMLYWREDVIRVRPFRREGAAAWRLRRVSDSECPQWQGVIERGNLSALQWAARIARVALGECGEECSRPTSTTTTTTTTANAASDSVEEEAQPHDHPRPPSKALPHSRPHGPGKGKGSAHGSPQALPAVISPYLDSLTRLESGTRSSICLLACKLTSLKGQAGRRLPGCICETKPPRADCSCGGGVGRGPHLNVDATPLMHRLPAVWRMHARLPPTVRPKLIVMLRQPELRTASHFQMLQKLARRGEEWAKIYVQSDTIDTKLPAEAREMANCFRSRLRPNAPLGELSPKVWHDCVAIACSFHACVVGQSIYVAQLKAWINTFGARQLHVLTLDEFAASTHSVLSSVSSFLGVRPFPRLVLNWEWSWNKNSRKKRLGEASNSTLAELRAFFAPFNVALIELLRKRRQRRAAHAVERWKDTPF